ncbi:MAG: hypothetical protein U5K69_11820 [Balneolaceae bacterium]|nr:hypothetical protein [Balneolaceae bacterium]
MRRLSRFCFSVFLILFVATLSANAFQASSRFTLENVFDLEYATDPQIAPEGGQVVYVRNFMDIMEDRRRSNLSIINADGTRHRPLTSGNNNNFTPRWSPSGDRLLYASTKESGGVELYMRWMDTGQTAKISNLTESPSGISWSPDGNWIAFTMFVSAEDQPMVSLPGRPEGADWAPSAKVVDKLVYRSDGSGYLEDGIHSRVCDACRRRYTETGYQRKL